MWPDCGPKSQAQIASSTFSIRQSSLIKLKFAIPRSQILSRHHERCPRKHDVHEGTLSELGICAPKLESLGEHEAVRSLKIT